MKNSFALLTALGFVVIFSMLSLFIIETKTLSHNVDFSRVIYTQTKMHTDFAKELIQNIEIGSQTKTLTVEEPNYDIKAYFTHETNGTVNVDLYVKPKLDGLHISIHESFSKD